MSYNLTGTGPAHPSLGEVIVTNGSYSFTADDYAVICQNTATIIITLPSPDLSNYGQQIIVKRGPSSSGQVDVSGDVDNVVGTVSLTTAGAVLQLVSDGTTWWKVN